MKTQIEIPERELQDFCHKWQIIELSLFGSVLRDDFTNESDVDVLVLFSPEAHTTLFDMVRLQAELEALFGRPVDLVSKRGIQASRNHLRRDTILGSAEVLYAA